jgi:ligand-binding SRPBCC domain-containing protein
MKIYHLSQKQKLPITHDVAWAFFSNPINLVQLTPPEIKMIDETFEPARRIYAGMIQIFKVRLLGVIPYRWVAEITHLEAPYAFVDEQKVGPFAFWHHRHCLVPIEGGVEVMDSVHYAMPFGFIGSLIHHFVVQKQLQAMFHYRAKMLAEFFGEF